MNLNLDLTQPHVHLAQPHVHLAQPHVHLAQPHVHLAYCMLSGYILWLYDTNIDHLNVHMLYQIGLFYQSLGNYEQMKKYFSWIIYSPTLFVQTKFYTNRQTQIKLIKSDTMFKLAKHYEKSNNVKLMIKYYKMAGNLDNSSALNDLGQYYFNSKSYDLAEYYYVRAIELNNSIATYNMAYYDQFITKNYIRMMSAYEKLISIRPIRPEAIESMINLAVYYKHQKNINQMLKYLNMAKTHGSSKAKLHLGLYYQENADVLNMTLHYEDLINSDDPEASIALNNMAMYYVGIGNNDQTLKYLKMGVEKNNAFADKNLGFFLTYIAKKPDEGIKYFISSIKKEFKLDILNEISEYYCSNFKNLTYSDIDEYIRQIYTQTKNITIKNEHIECPITMNECNMCFQTKCGHKFSFYVLFLNICPVCRTAFVDKH
jgi:hypothetical protein